MMISEFGEKVIRMDYANRADEEPSVDPDFHIDIKTSPRFGRKSSSLQKSPIRHSIKAPPQ